MIEASEAAVMDAIESAEEVADPIDGLADRTAADPGAPFAPEAVAALAALKKADRAAFEALRARLKKAGARVMALDEAIAEENGDGGGRPSQADDLIELAKSAELFHTADGTGFADVEVNGHRETWPIRSKGFKRWLSRLFYEQTGGAPNAEALQGALNVIEAKADHDAPERVVHVRVGGLDGKLYVDLADSAWRAVEIDSDGWRMVDAPPVRFRRASGMRALPAPTRGGSIAALRSFLNVATDQDFVLVVAWALAALRSMKPYPLMVLSGEQGSAKSTFSAILRAIIDPNTAPLRALPREDRDLFIAANNGHILVFDNVSAMPAWISDTLCRLATGGGFAVRQLYSDDDERLFDAARPVILNGIDDVVTRPDLADRALLLTLAAIPEEARRPEADLWSAFEREHPAILGALLDAVSHGLKMLPQTRLARLPRMADFAIWATACESSLWPPGTFCAAYDGNRGNAIDGVIDADPVAAAVRTLMVVELERTQRTQTDQFPLGALAWMGTASELLEALGQAVGESGRRAKTWPDSPKALGDRLRRAATFLRKVGIDIAFDREGKRRTRVVRISAAADRVSSRASASSALSASNEINGLERTQKRTQDSAALPTASAPRTLPTSADAGPTAADARDPDCVRPNPLTYNAADAADAADAVSSRFSALRGMGMAVLPSGGLDFSPPPVGRWTFDTDQGDVDHEAA